MTLDVKTTAPTQAAMPTLELRLPDPVITPGEWPAAKGNQQRLLTIPG